jgi:hypothetical protein
MIRTMERIMARKEISVKKYVVKLSSEERQQLETLIRKGKGPARRLLKARILLKADVSDAGPGWSDSKIVAALDTSASMLYRVRKQLVEVGFDAVLSRKQRVTPAVARIFDGEKEAKLIALACSKPPKGRVCWTLRLLENKVVELGIVERASDSTIYLTLKKNRLKPHRRQCWVIPPKANSAFVAAMEDVLAVYMRPHDPDRVLVCLDETSKRLIAETRVPIPMKPGRAARVDYEYERNGTMRASLVVKCQSDLVLLVLWSCCQAAISSMRVCLSGMRRSRHWAGRTPSSDSARSSQLPCLGV